MKAARVATDNHAAALPAKVEIRERILAAVPDAAVFDAFAGSGEMYRRVWHRAPGYVGCDTRYFADDRPAFVADNRRVLRAIDLTRYGIFDLDAYGSPWEQAIIIAGRRLVQPGERIGMCLTDGSNVGLRLGGISRSLTLLTGMKLGTPGMGRAIDEMMHSAAAGIAARMRCGIERAWLARGASNSKMLYLGLVLVGIGSGGDVGGGARRGEFSPKPAVE